MWLDLVWLHRHLDPRWWRDMILIDVMFVALFFHRHWSCEKRKTVDIEIQCLLRFRFVYQRRECGPKYLEINITNQILIIYIHIKLRIYCISIIYLDNIIFTISPLFHAKFCLLGFSMESLSCDEEDS